MNELRRRSRKTLRTDPRFYLAAEPVERTEIPSLFRSSGVVEVLRNPPTFRSPTVGWDLWTLDEARIVEGRKRVLVNGDRKRLTLFPDERGQAVVHHGRGHHADSGMAMVLVVPRKERVAESAAVLDRAEAIWELGAIFHGAELAF